MQYKESKKHVSQVFYATNIDGGKKDADDEEREKETKRHKKYQPKAEDEEEEEEKQQEIDQALGEFGLGETEESKMNYMAMLEKPAKPVAVNAVAAAA